MTKWKSKWLDSAELKTERKKPCHKPVHLIGNILLKHALKICQIQHVTLSNRIAVTFHVLLGHENDRRNAVLR